MGDESGGDYRDPRSSGRDLNHYGDEEMFPNGVAHVEPEESWNRGEDVEEEEFEATGTQNKEGAHTFEAPAVVLEHRDV